MKIFLPFKKDANNYFDEIIRFSQCEFVFDNYKNYDSSFKIINIHWPESIFDWRDCTSQELNDFEKTLLYWKKHSKIIYTVHNLKPHSGFTENLKKLYKLVESNADFFIHLGAYSKSKFEKKFPNAVHHTLRHPLYSNSFKVYDQTEARESLGIKKDAIVIMAAGKIRNAKEKKILLNAFHAVKNKKKVLIVPNMFNIRTGYDFPGYYRFKKWLDYKTLLKKLFIKKYNKPQYLFSYEYVSNDKLALMMSASDIVFIPRIEILNSGNVFLGLTFNKIIVGPDKGNIKEYLEMFQFPVFNPKSPRSISHAINKAVHNLLENEHKIDSELLKPFLPVHVAAEFDKLIEILK